MNPGRFKFRTITSVHRSSEGGFNVYDARLGRLSRFDAEGDPVSTEPLLPPASWADLIPLSVASDGRVLPRRRMPALGVLRDTTPLLAYRQPGAAPDTPSRLPTEETVFALGEDGGWSSTSVGFGPSLAAFGTNQLAVLGDTDRLEVHLMNPAGDLLMGTRGGGEPVPTTESEGDQWRRDRVARLPSSYPPVLRESTTRRLSTAPFRESYPAFHALAVDTTGRVWIGESVRYGARERRWVVFEADGTPMASLELPASARILDVTTTQLLLSTRDELDVEGVSLWEIHWPLRDG